MTPPTQSIDETLAELVEEFDLLGDWEGRIEYGIDLGKGLAPLAGADRTGANKVPGRAAQVWRATRRTMRPTWWRSIGPRWSAMRRR